MNNSFLEQLEYRPELGSLLFKGVRYLLIRPETLLALHRALEAELGPEKAGQLLFNAGYTGGKLSGEKYKTDLKLGDREAVKFMCKMGAEIGWGHFRLADIRSEPPSMTIEIMDSVFADAYQRETEQGICHLSRGVFGGLAEAIFSQSVVSLETKCLAKGDQFCEIRIDAA
jgi:predicted hydrocarbon binding protein